MLVRYVFTLGQVAGMISFLTGIYMLLGMAPMLVTAGIILLIASTAGETVHLTRSKSAPKNEG
jgi:hypothetical protein